MENKIEISHIHDTYFKELFSEKERVRIFLSTFFPELGRHIEVASIELQPTEKLSIEAKERVFFDLAIDCRIKGIDAKLYIIFEHKSYADRRVVLQFLRYILAIWEKDIEQRRPLTPVIPMLFYTGKPIWNIPTNTLEVSKTLPEEIQQYLLRLNYLFFDVRGMKDEILEGKIGKERLYFLELEFLKLFAEGAGKEAVIQALLEYISALMEEGYEERAPFIIAIKRVIFYVQGAHKIESKELREMLGKGGERMKTLVDELIEEGMQKGLIVDAQEMVLSAIEAKLDHVPEGIQRRIRQINDREYLRSLLKEVVKASAVFEVLKKYNLQ